MSRAWRQLQSAGVAEAVARKAARRASVPTEWQEQVAVVDWADQRAIAVDGALRRVGEFLYAVPNGSMLGGDARLRAIQVGRLKRAGMRVGVLDLVLDLPRGRFHGLRLEMKRRGGRPSSEQREWVDRLRSVGYDAQIAEGAEEAIKIIVAYLAQGSSRMPRETP